MFLIKEQINSGGNMAPVVIPEYFQCKLCIVTLDMKHAQ